MSAPMKRSCLSEESSRREVWHLGGAAQLGSSVAAPGANSYARLNRTIAVGVGEFRENWVGYSSYAVL